MSPVLSALPVDAVRAQVRGDLELIDAAYARLRGSCTDLVGNAFRVETAERLETLHRVNRGLSYRMFAEIADPVDGPDPAMPSDVATRHLLGSRLRITAADVKRRFRTAVRIRPRRSLTGPALPPELPKLATAVEEGALGDDHIAAITRALDVLPSAVSVADHEKAERTLVRHATRQDAKFVAAVGERIADCLNPDGNFSDEDRAKRRGLMLGPQCVDGMSRLSGWLDPEARAYLEAVTAAIRTGRHLPADAPVEQRDRRTPAQRCHDALKLGLRTAISSGGLGVHRGVPVTVIVTTKLGELEQAARAARDPSIPMPAPARTGGNSRLPMRDLIRMAGGSIHYLAVFEDHSERPLYLGRSKRIATLDQRVICHARDGGCTRPDCLEPGYHCEVHHGGNDWAGGGQTNADELYFACPPNHSEATCGNLTTTITDDGRLAWSDGTGPPRVNRVHHPDELLDDENDP